MSESERVRIRIVYKSGAVQDFTCTEFRIQTDALDRRHFSWQDADPSPLMLGADDIAAVWQLGEDVTIETPDPVDAWGRGR